MGKKYRAERTTVCKQYLEGCIDIDSYLKALRNVDGKFSNLIGLE